MVNIDRELREKPEFSEVKELRRKLNILKARDSLFENSKPSSLNLAKKLS
jgi:hypothetical protein